MKKPYTRAVFQNRLASAVAAFALIATGAVALPAFSAGAAGADPSQQVSGNDDERADRDGCAPIPQSLPTLADWPRIDSRIKTSKQVEAKVKATLAKMTLAQKVGQMTQPEITSITPDEVRQYHIGSVLNGGGSWPNGDKHAAQADWLELADAYWAASKQSQSAVPVIWGIDAVHGNNNVYGATVFPHNIGLGAARNPCLIREIGEATAAQVRATGQDWAFAPTLAVVRDDRWGRTYEGFSEDPRIVRAYGYEAIKGLQGKHPLKIQPDGVIATAKHFIGDGGTIGGKDQGVNPSSEQEMINVHGQGYYGALAAGAQSVMVSFNSWTNEALGINQGKLHGSKKAVDEILKNKMGFDGLVVSDWNGIGQVSGCSNFRCAQAVNAGIDVFMVPGEWKAFIDSTIALVEAGEIPMTRIDDAVTRILRVKIRSGVFEAPKPSQRQFADSAAALEHRAVARKAVRESQVLLKNNGKLLPLAATSKVLVVGKSADSMQNQTGGWTLSWQGTGNSNSDFPNGTTILAGLKESLGEANVTFSETGEGVDPSQYDAVIAVVGETPYAEGNGDLAKRSLEFGRLYPADRAVIERVSGKGAPVVTVFVAGRPLYVNHELNLSQAFVAAWLPGTEGGGVSDLLVRAARNRVGYTGRLSYSWPKGVCQSPLNIGDADYDPLFPYGFGLRDHQGAELGTLAVESQARCGGSGGGGTATEELEIFVREDIAPYKAFIGSPDNWGGTEIGNDVNAVISHTNISVRTVDVTLQQDGKEATWKGGPAQYYMGDPAGGSDLRGYVNANSALVFDTIVSTAPTAKAVLSMHCEYPCFSEVTATKLFTEAAASGVRRTVKIPLECFNTGTLEFENINTPFLVYTDGTMKAAFANVRWVPGAAADADAIKCTDLT